MEPKKTTEVKPEDSAAQIPSVASCYLKTCPFCGGAAYREIVNDILQVGCGECLVSFANHVRFGCRADVEWDNRAIKIADPLFDKTNDLFIALAKSQELLANYITPDSGISDITVINDLLGILDDSKLVILMRELTGDDR